MRSYCVLFASFFGATFCGMAYTITDSYSDCEGYVSFISDGDCDASNNNADCGYDGGDCCLCDCEDASYQCGDFGDFNCIDPSSNCYGVDDDLYADCLGIFYYIGDGFCDLDNNNSACGYDGGDCCSCECDDASYECGIAGYDCVDPDSACFGEDGDGNMDSDDEDGDGNMDSDDEDGDGNMDSDDEDGDGNMDSDDGAIAIVGIAVGGVLVVVAGVALVVLCMTGRLKTCACCPGPSAQPLPSTLSLPPPPSAGGAHRVQAMPIAQTNAGIASGPVAPPAYGQHKQSNIPPPPPHVGHVVVSYYGSS